MHAVETFPSRPALYETAAARIVEALQSGIAARGAACAALSGGATPEPAYALLSKHTLDWTKVTFALVDERCVPPDHPASNEAMLRRALAEPLQHGARLEPLYSPGAPEAAAAKAEPIYAALHLDIALMGMGADGHIASWFPGADGLAEALDFNSPRSVIALHAPQAAGSADRLSLTRAALARAARIVLLIVGEEKKAALEHELAEPGAPVAALFDAGMPAPEILWAR